jgi:hypothetical protein
MLSLFPRLTNRSAAGQAVQERVAAEGQCQCNVNAMSMQCNVNAMSMQCQCNAMSMQCQCKMCVVVPRFLARGRFAPRCIPRLKGPLAP